jgi:GntR family transcriptional regulator
MQPEIERRPRYQQVADHYRDQIVRGELTSGARLPSQREIAEEFGIPLGTANRAVAHLVTSGLVRTERTGTFVNGPAQVLAPQERLSAAYSAGVLFPFGERIEIRSAALVPVPAYVEPILGIGPGSRVIRREYLTGDDRGPFTLSVSWYPPEFAEPVPELLQASPIPATTLLIRERTGRRVTNGEDAMESRRPLDDGREVPLLGITHLTAVLAVVNTWMDGEDVIEYDEHVIVGRTITYRYNVDGPEAG